MYDNKGQLWVNMSEKERSYIEFVIGDEKLLKARDTFSETLAHLESARLLISSNPTSGDLDYVIYDANTYAERLKKANQKFLVEKGENSSVVDELDL